MGVLSVFHSLLFKRFLAGLRIRLDFTQIRIQPPKEKIAKPDQSVNSKNGSEPTLKDNPDSGHS